MYSWHIVLNQFQAYNSVIWHLYTLWNVHHNKCSYDLSPYKVMTNYLYSLGCTSSSLWLTYFITGCLYVFISLLLSPIIPAPSLWQPPICSLYLWVCVCVFWLVVHLFCFLNPICKWNCMVFVCLCLACFTEHKNF